MIKSKNSGRALVSASKPKRLINKKKVLIFTCALLSLLLILCIYPFLQWARGNVIDGVKIGSYSLSNMTYEQVKQLVNKNLNPALNSGALVLTDSDKRHQITIYPKDIGAEFEPYDTFAAAYKIGRMGQGSNDNIFAAIIEVYKAKFFGLDAVDALKYNSSKLGVIIKDYAGNEFEEMSVVPSYAIEGDKLLITPGKSGRQLNVEKTQQLVIKKMSALDFSAAQCVFEIVAAKPINIEEIYKNVVKKASDAKIVFDQNGKQTIQVEVLGVDFDLSAAKKTITDPYSSYTIPLTITRPKITYKDLESNPDTGIFKDVLGTFTTTLDTSLVNRTHNVRLASEKINNTILNPGDEFSFNKTVGPRELSTGFLEAKVYMANEIVDGVGGGICQVSSTLYVTSLLADMTILERQNHRFTVSYVNPGYDATVAYGITDYRFKNPYDTPIKITTQLSGNKLTMQIRGTKPSNMKSYQLSYSVYDRVDYTVRTKTDTTLKEGDTRVLQGGQQGYTAQLFRSYKATDGSTVKELVNTSKYSPADRIILVNEPAASTSDTKNTDNQSANTQTQTQNNTQSGNSQASGQTTSPSKPSSQQPGSIIPGLDAAIGGKTKGNNLPPELGGAVN